jgi:hypothetical protein
VRHGVHYSITGMDGSRSVGDRFEAPERFTIRVDDPNLACLVELDVDNTGPEPACVEVRATRRPHGPVVTGAMLRAVRVGTYLRDGTQDAVMPIHVAPSSGREVSTWPPSDEEQTAYLQARRHEKQPDRRITDDQLARVADTYRQALSLGQHPTAEVQQRLRLRSRAQAARWVSKAREAGFLGPAPGRRRAGEAPTEQRDERAEPAQGDAPRPRRPPPGEHARSWVQPIPPKRPKEEG